MIFQVDTSVVIRHNLANRDLGKWCFLCNGGLVGFYRSRKEAENLYAQML